MKNKKHLLIIILLSIIALLPFSVKAIGNGQYSIYCEDESIVRDATTKCHILIRKGEFGDKDIMLFDAAIDSQSQGAIITGPGTPYESTFSQTYATDKNKTFVEQNEGIATLFTDNGYTANAGDACFSTSLEGCFEYGFPSRISSLTPEADLKYIKDLDPDVIRRNEDVNGDKVSVGYINMKINTEDLAAQDCARLCVSLTAYQKNDSDVYEPVAVGTECAEVFLKKVCYVTTVGDEEVYHGIDGEEVTKEEYLAQCTTPENPVCRIEDGHYFDDEGTEVEKEVYEKKCLCRIDEDDNYYDHTGEKVTKEKWAEECLCRIQDGHYFDDVGNLVDEKTWKAKCEKKCYYDEENEKYYGKEGEEITKEQFEEDCIPPTGSFASYAVLIAGALIALSAITIAKKHNRFYRV